MAGKTATAQKIDPETGLPPRSIVKTTEPQKYGIRVADYLI